MKIWQTFLRTQRNIKTRFRFSEANFQFFGRTCPQTPEISSCYSRVSTGCSWCISRKEPCKAHQEEADFIPFPKAFLGRILCALFYQFFDVLSDFFGFDHWRVAAIWLAIVVHKKFLKVPCYIVVSDWRPLDLIEIINKVVRRWTSILSKWKASNGTVTTTSLSVTKNCNLRSQGLSPFCLRWREAMKGKAWEHDKLAFHGDYG